MDLGSVPLNYITELLNPWNLQKKSTNPHFIWKGEHWTSNIVMVPYPGSFLHFYPQGTATALRKRSSLPPWGQICALPTQRLTGLMTPQVSTVIPLIGTVPLKYLRGKMNENQTHMFQHFSFKYISLVEYRCVASDFLFFYWFIIFPKQSIDIR